MPSLNRRLRAAGMLIATLTFAAGALAGPPLICHPFTTGAGAPLLPWAEGNEWHLPHRSYERANLVDDMLGLLSADAPILVRMENMRRAAIYAEENPATAAELLRAVVARTQTQPSEAHVEALEWFDAGYLVETYRQLGLIYQHGMLPPHDRWTSLVPAELAALDGYALVHQAIALAPGARAELEFAAALMTREPMMTAHLRRAASGAAAGSLLANNLVHYDVR